MSIEQNNKMREIMTLVEEYAQTNVIPEENQVDQSNGDDQAEITTENHHPIIKELHELIFKLRSHTENEDGEKALGVEEGMMRAADMIENLLRRYEDMT